MFKMLHLHVGKLSDKLTSNGVQNKHSPVIKRTFQLSFEFVANPINLICQEGCKLDDGWMDAAISSLKIDLLLHLSSPRVPYTIILIRWTGCVSG